LRETAGCCVSQLTQHREREISIASAFKAAVIVLSEVGPASHSVPVTRGWLAGRDVERLRFDVCNDVFYVALGEP
jgi:hypothetical protein